MSQLGFYFDASSCSGCRACQAACKDRNDLPVGMLFRRVNTYQTGAYPAAKMYSYSRTCNHCASPACVANCPTGAMCQADDGTVQHNDAECIGCQTCVNSCPYEIPQYDEEQNISRKCDSCKAYRDAGMNPVCVDACCMRVLDFGDLDELRAKYGDDLVNEIPALPVSETNPSLLIKTKEAVLSDDFRDVII
ncbi:4Fe-4S dicluster domain-containing protein [Adlercreutzia sp. R7]|uniref:4Fe-4S dicluster domain-containing protein n=1 Tax=Adlercreutzia wanghongyangiae TaxID=3111451 RepID=A0ABU6IKS1_9ACTN|nr:4Fe-4S dicluster domain-containing protein [Adlercreutzia sp. R7]